jgi:3-oxoacyl-[acyl-carrier protein] reductase
MASTLAKTPGTARPGSTSGAWRAPVRSTDVTEMTRTAVVTGGGTGLGRAIADRLATDGLEVTIVGRRAEALETATKEINAGENAPATGDDLEALARDWAADYRLDVLTAVLPVEVLLPRMARPGGRVVAMSSISALRGHGSYGASKGAINTWITGLAAEVAADGITANAVAPGFVPDTEFWDSRRGPELIEERTSRIPVGRPGRPGEVAALVAHLTAPEAGFTTGQVVGIHGGAVLARLRGPGGRRSTNRFFWSAEPVRQIAYDARNLPRPHLVQRDPGGARRCSRPGDCGRDDRQPNDGDDPALDR